MPDYPTEIELETIRYWVVDDLDEYHAIMDYIHDRWQYANSGYWTQEGDIYKISTAGWSGNESLIGAMQDNFVFWAMYWVSSRRGGHYVFAPMGTDLPE